VYEQSVYVCLNCIIYIYIYEYQTGKFPSGDAGLAGWVRHLGISLGDSVCLR
jgi:hypothetical protein